MKQSILVGVDGSDSAFRAVDRDAAEASRRDHGLLLLTAFAMPAAEAAFALTEEVRRGVHTILDRAQQRARALHPGLDIDRAAVLDSPARALLYRAGTAETVAAVRDFPGVLAANEEVPDLSRCLRMALEEVGRASGDKGTRSYSARLAVELHAALCLCLAHGKEDFHASADPEKEGGASDQRPAGPKPSTPS